MLKASDSWNSLFTLVCCGGGAPVNSSTRLSKKKSEKVFYRITTKTSKYAGSRYIDTAPVELLAFCVISFGLVESLTFKLNFCDWDMLRLSNDEELEEQKDGEKA